MRFDWLGTFLLALALAAYALAMTAGRGHWGKLNFALLTMACISTGLLFWRKRKSRHPCCAWRCCVTAGWPQAW